jgi:hypothetical protein
MPIFKDVSGTTGGDCATNNSKTDWTTLINSPQPPLKETVPMVALV